MTESVRDLVNLAVVLYALETEVKSRRAKVMKELAAEHLDPGDRKYARVDGEEIGSLSFTVESNEAWVDDAQALLDWVRRQHPENVYTPPVQERVREAFVDYLLGAAKAAGDAVDPKTGELIPGISVSVKKPSLRPNSQTASQKRRTAELWDSGALQHLVSLGTPQIETTTKGEGTTDAIHTEAG